MSGLKSRLSAVYCSGSVRAFAIRPTQNDFCKGDYLGIWLPNRVITAPAGLLIQTPAQLLAISREAPVARKRRGFSH
jgi:hypothetical protein